MISLINSTNNLKIGNTEKIIIVNQNEIMQKEKKKNKKK